jgi:hypothetical protein
MKKIGLSIFFLQYKKLSKTGVIAAVLVMLTALVLAYFPRSSAHAAGSLGPSSGSSSPVLTSPTTVPTAAPVKIHAFKKSLVFKKFGGGYQVPANLPASNYTTPKVGQAPRPQIVNPQTTIRVPQINTYIPPPSIRNPTMFLSPNGNFVYQSPTTLYSRPFSPPPMFFQSPGIPYANPNYVPPINSTLPGSGYTSPFTTLPGSGFTAPNYTPPQFYNPPIYNPPVYTPPLRIP